jgi:GTP-binding protein
VAGTTRDAIDTRYNLYGKDFILVDTAGIRKKGKIEENIEFYSVLRSLQALENADVCVVMLDATRGIESQDVQIIFLAQRYKKGIVILVNKWDLIEKDTKTSETFKKDILERLAPMEYVPILFTSMVTKQRVYQAIETAVQVYENRSKRVPTSALNDTMLKEIERYPPPAVKGKYIKIKYVTQLPTKTPTIAFFCNLPQYIKPPYQRYLENRLREHFDFTGVPITLVFRKK